MHIILHALSLFYVSFARGVTRLDGAQGLETSLALPCSNLRSFVSKCIALKK